MLTSNKFVCCCLHVNVNVCRKPKVLHKMFKYPFGITFTPNVMVKSYKGTTHWHKLRLFADCKTSVSIFTRGKKVNNLYLHINYTWRYHCSLELSPEAFLKWYTWTYNQPRGLVDTVSDYWSWGPGFDSQFCHGDFSLKGKIPLATLVWVVSRL
jgi:hypothetical protein